MSQTPTMAVATSHSNYQIVFDHALDAYKKNTGKDLGSHPLLRKLEACDSPNDILTMLRGDISGSDQSCSSNERLTKWLDPAVNILYTFSATIGADIGLVYPPAAVIFTGIGVLLSAAKATSANQEALLELFERIESFFRRLETYIKVPPTSGMVEILVKVMVEVLSILAIATKEINQNGAKTFLKKLVGRADIGDALQRLDQLTEEEARMVNAEGLKTAHDIDHKVEDIGGIVTSVSSEVQGIHHTVNDVDKRVKDVDKRVKVIDESVKDIGDKVIDGVEKISRQIVKDFNRDKFRQNLSKWLSPPDPSVNYNTACEAHHEGTTVWFTQSSTFKDWKASGSLLWIHGKPGSGKSVLTSAIIRDIEGIVKSGSAHMAYFFFDFRDKEKQNARALLTSTLVQLSNKSDTFCDNLLDLYSSYQHGSQQPSHSALLQCLQDILESPGQTPTYIVIDALDECPDTHVQSSREKVLDLVEVLVGLQLANLRLCITSRPEVDIRTALVPLTSTSSRISLHDESGQKKDIVDYVHFVVHSDRKMRHWRKEEKKLVIETLSHRADGMFRWVSCQFETVRRCLAPSLRRVLSELPETLDETYERVLQEIPNANREHAHRLLQCLTVAIRPLRVQELAEVLTVDTSPAGGVPNLNENWRWEDQEQAVLSACSSLIIVVGSPYSRIVQFSHFSVKEFLTSNRLAASKLDVPRYHHIRLGIAHATMARVCIGVLLRFDNRIDEDSIKRFPLAPYAAFHLADHAEFESVISHITDDIDPLLDAHKPHFAAWMSYRSKTWQWETHVGRLKAVPLYHVANLGFRCLVQYLIMKRPQDIVACGGGYGTALHSALRGRHVSVFRQLLSHDVDANVRDSDGQTPLHLAASEGLLEFTEILIGHYADINAQDNDGLTPLHRTLTGAYASLKDKKLRTMRLLLEHGADVGVQNNCGTTPLLLAANNGNLEAVQLLLEHGASVHARNKRRRTPLHCASWGGYTGIIRVLLQYGSDKDAQDDQYDTPLHILARNGEHDVIQLLLQHGAIVHLQDDEGRTPLHCASSAGHADVIRILLERSADHIDGQDNHHATPLNLAVFSGKLEAVQLLLEHGASVGLLNGVIAGTPLHVASQIGHPDVILLLLGHGADLDARNFKHETPLHLAVLGRELEAARLLLQHGATADAQRIDGQTPLHLASNRGYLDIMRVLLEHGAATYARTSNHATPLHLAVQAGKLKAVRLLLQHGAVVHVRGSFGESPLHLASWAGYHYVIRVLLEHGADVELKNDRHETPLHLAAIDGNIEAAQVLVEHSAMVDSRDEFDSTPLHFASWGGYHDIIRLLLEHGADVEAQNDSHNTPLHWAAHHGKLAVTQLLLEHGAAVHAQNELGRAPLHLASWGGFPEVIHLLLEHGADVEAEDNYRIVPLHLAASEGNFAVTQLLVERGAAVHVRDTLDNTPLHVASCKGYPDIVQFLVEHGADVEAKDHEHVTPLNLAVQNGAVEAARLLLEHGSNAHVRDKMGHTPFELALAGENQEIIELFSKHVPGSPS